MPLPAAALLTNADRIRAIHTITGKCFTAFVGRYAPFRHSGRQTREWAPAAPLASRASAPARLRVARGWDASLPVLLLAVAAGAWWFTVRQSGEMAVAVSPTTGDMPGMDMSAASTVLSPASFLLAWAAMMAAMMLPAVTPVVRLYARAAALGRVAPAGFFVSGYLAIWVLSGVPAYLLWRVMGMPLMDAEPWALRIAGAALVIAGVYQLSPLKRACLRHCRSPMSYFLRRGHRLGSPTGAAKAGSLHGFFCFGCCFGLMLVLVLTAAMQPLWAAAIAAAVFVERNVSWGESFSILLAAALSVLGGATLIHPALAAALVQGV